MDRDCTVDAYLAELERLAPSGRRARRRLLREVEDHIHDTVTALAPMPSDRATAVALRRLGSPLSIANADAGRSLPAVALAPTPTRIEARVSCDGRRVHTLRWDDGALVAVDHEQTAELALAAMGAPTPRCIEIVRAWRQPYESALALVTQWLDPDATAPDLEAERCTATSAAWGQFGSLLPGVATAATLETRWSRALIASLPYHLRAKFCEGVLRSAERRARTADAEREALSRVNADLAWTAIRTRVTGPKPTLIEIGKNETAALQAMTSGLRLTLPLTWARSVAAAGSTTIWGRLVIERRAESVVVLDWHHARQGMVPVALELATD